MNAVEVTTKCQFQRKYAVILLPSRKSEFKINRINSHLTHEGHYDGHYDGHHDGHHHGHR